jgi:hypothetical protein
VTLKTAGNQIVTATDTTTATINGNDSVQVSPSAATTLAVADFPASNTAGVPGNFTVTAKDAYGNTATAYAGTVTFSSSDAQATVPADSTLTNGVGNFSATLETVGSQSLTATDTVTGTITGSQSGITVTPAAATVLVVSGFPSPATAGVQHSVTVTARDAFGNTDTNYTGTVTFSSSDGQATLPANYTFTLGDAGVVNLPATLKTSGTQSITATDTVTGSITGTQSAITVNPSAAVTLDVTGYPSTTTAGDQHLLTVTARDAYGNIATGYTGTVTFSSSDAQATLPANYTFTLGDAGVRTFPVTLKTAGSQSISSTDTVTGSITGSQSGITVAAAAAASFVVAGYPSSTTAGDNHSFSVTARDAYGNTAVGYAGTVTFSSNDPQADLPVDSTLVNGTGVFNATLKSAGSRSITAADTVNGSITGTQSGIVVTPAAAAVFALTPSAAPVRAGFAVQVTLTAYDAYQNVATGYTGTVHFTSSDGGAILPADYTFVAGDQGVRKFSVRLFAAGAQTVTATDTVNGSITDAITLTVVVFNSTGLTPGPTPPPSGTPWP